MLCAAFGGYWGSVTFHSLFMGVRDRASGRAGAGAEGQYEIDAVREAARRLARSRATCPAEVRRGRTERDVAAAIDRRVRLAGFERPAFDTIVASGPNAALPHAHPGERKLPKATSSCWTSAASTTHTASTSPVR